MEYIHKELTTRYKVQAGIIVGTHSDGRKATTEQRREAQKMPILIASVSIVSKALNIPELDTMVVLSGGAFVNDTFWRQAIGRITRDNASKQDPELVLLRDRYESKIDPRSDGMFAHCVDAACRTLRNYSPRGFQFSTIPVALS
jgi:superfamily II DNA or RNA helicase